ncbi:protein arginine N-methyltransferase 5 [Cladophialophora psammophila CBS 110553]|uniref:Protein arginine N-methyltransferase 5 n=1 Tax=Cladophialophora psammophila CBS 110553 TaxID=1182543 RepID=W9X384_9EURO|nr:protein arginine N-methyltransferase 5 [Cladophialophora psammophila CBS 110553]EXJ74927.1 protein arginine N-methyltransferase 5 [Cladophialophora psammophila CBS 110553]
MEEAPRFIIGHHDPKRPIPVSMETVQDAHAANYDIVTSPITTPHFHSRVLTLLSSSLPFHSEEDITKTKSGSPVIIPPLTPADTPLTPDESISQTIGITSSWIDLGSPDPIIADVSRQVLQLELAYAAFCGLTYVLIPGPRLRGQGVSDSGVAQCARVILDALGQAPYMQLYIWFPMIDHSKEQVDQLGNLALFVRPQFLEQDEAEIERLDLFGTWEAWNLIRSICKYPSRLCVALAIPKLLPPVPIQSRWYSEPIRLLTLDKQMFAKNAKGYPVLTRAHQSFILRFSRLRTAPWFLLCDVGTIPNSTTNSSMANPAAAETNAFPTLAEAAQTPDLKDPTPHLSYMRNLQTKQPPQSLLDRFGAGYQDYLQAPLQPLTVNLESITYEVFEKDPIKYAWYERAIARALHDWIEQGKPTSNPDGRVVVAVVGAGRGPLVTRALKASQDVGVEIDMWALEKNPNAFVLLQRHNKTTWRGRVNLVKSDMRTWRGPIGARSTANPTRIYNTSPDSGDDDGNDGDGDKQKKNAEQKSTAQPTFTGSPTLDTTYLLATSTQTTTPTPYKIDILISELLGSFGDNELSPECLDGVQHLLNPVHGISIPASYTAHITPIAAPKLHADILHGMGSNPNAGETPYVVMFNAIDYLSTRLSAGTEAEPSRGLSTGAVQSHPTPSEMQSPTSPPETSTTVATPYSRAHTRQPQQPVVPHPPTPPTPVPVIQQTWAFLHPNPALPTLSPSTIGTTTTELSLTNSHNARSCQLTFPIPHRGTCHGLAGYFETVLYKGVELSTNPDTMDQKSEGMISWFPIFFPLKTPLFLPDNSEISLTMWRKTDDRKVWYEWLVDVYLYVPSSSSPQTAHAAQQQQPLGQAQSMNLDGSSGGGAGGDNNNNNSKGKRKGLPASALMTPPAPPAPPALHLSTGSASAPTSTERGTQPPRCAAVARGRRVRVGGSELHSSEKEACLM